MDKVIVVAGSTGTGKSALAVKLAKEFNGEIISGDSMQVYRGMDIGTAKITEEEMEGIPHHLIDIQDPLEPYDVSQFQRLCREKIADITSRQKLPILCGGTGLYLKAALYDYEFKEDNTDPALKAQLEALPADELWDRLHDIDPESADKIHPNNKKRVIRALLISQGGLTKTDIEKAQKHEPLYDVFWIGLEAKNNEEALKARIAKMDADGLEDEVRAIFSDPATWKATSFLGIGYKEWRPYLEDKCTKEEVLEQIFIHTRQYARRQRTWFRHQMPVNWYEKGNDDQIFADVKGWLHDGK